MPTLRRYDLFISHAWHRSEDYARIAEMLDDATNFDWKNNSVPEHDPLHVGDNDELKKQLRNQIRPSNAVIVLCGMYASHSEWMEFEIDFAHYTGRPIIGVKPWGSERIPAMVQDAAKVIVGWNTDSIVKAVRDWSLDHGN